MVEPQLCLLLTIFLNLFLQVVSTRSLSSWSSCIISWEAIFYRNCPHLPPVQAKEAGRQHLAAWLVEQACPYEGRLGLATASDVFDVPYCNVLCLGATQGRRLVGLVLTREVHREVERRDRYGLLF